MYNNDTKKGSLFYLFSLSNMLDLIRRTSVHSTSLLYFDVLQQSLSIVVHTCATISLEHAVTSLPSCISSATTSQPSLNRPIHSYNVEQLMLLLPYTAVIVFRISAYVLPDLTRNLIATHCSILASTSMLHKNQHVIISSPRY